MERPGTRSRPLSSKELLQSLRDPRGGFFGATWHFLDIVCEDSLAGVGRCSIQCHRVDLESGNAGVLNFVPWTWRWEEIGRKRELRFSNAAAIHLSSGESQACSSFSGFCSSSEVSSSSSFAERTKVSLQCCFFELLCGAEPNCIRCSSTFRSHFHDSGAYEDSTMLGASVLGEALGFSELQGP